MRAFSKAAVVASIVAGMTLIASTAMGAPTTPKLSFFKEGGASIGWTTVGGSSPSDPYANNSSIEITNPAGGDAGAYTYGGSETLVDLRGRTLAQIDRLGFDSKGYLGAGAPRISLGTTGSSGDHTFFLSAYYCHSAPSNGWVTSDFADSAVSPGTSTGGVIPAGFVTPGCYIFDQNGVAYGPNGLSSVAAAFPDDVVVSAANDWFLIQDEGPAHVFVDRLTAERWMWVRSGTAGRISCANLGCI